MEKMALITGASSGIGKEYAKIFSSRGYDLIIVARSTDKLLKIKEEYEGIYHNKIYVKPCDLSNLEAADDIYNYVIQNKLEVNTLVNNAGFADYGYFYEFDNNRQNDLLNVNIMSLVRLTKLFLPQMVEKREGNILNVASVAAFIAGPKMSLYYASKAFVRSFSEAIHEEVLKYNVHVTALCPGPVSTNFDKASNMNGSHMFTSLKPQNAYECAMKGYNGLLKNKALVYPSLTAKFLNIASRLFSRRKLREGAFKINN